MVNTFVSVLVMTRQKETNFHIKTIKYLSVFVLFEE